MMLVNVPTTSLELVREGVAGHSLEVGAELLVEPFRQPVGSNALRGADEDLVDLAPAEHRRRAREAE